MVEQKRSNEQAQAGQDNQKHGQPGNGLQDRSHEGLQGDGQQPNQQPGQKPSQEQGQGQGDPNLEQPVRQKPENEADDPVG